MTHFVPIPPDREYWVPKLRELSLFDKNATAAINVWGLPAGATVEAENNPRFVAQPYRKNGDLTSFYLRGLVGGDKIAVFLTDGRMWTAWLPIKLVSGDKHAKQRADGKLPRSRHMKTVTLDPHGSEQRHPPVSEQAWLTGVENAIGKIRGNAVGRIITGSLIKDITIRPFIPADVNADSSVVFTAQTFAGNKSPGAQPDEVLFHEFCHVLEDNFSGYANSAADGLQFSGSDFFTVMATNVYASLVGRPLRASHAGFTPMIALYASPTSGVAALKTNHAGNFSSIRARMPAVAKALGKAAAPWNPFR
jgi:hypothetical protein